jgi:hypothetical protein
LVLNYHYEKPICDLLLVSVLKSNKNVSLAIPDIFTQAEKVHFKAFVGVLDVLDKYVLAIIAPN